MTEPRMAFTAALLFDGRVLVAGSGDGHAVPHPPS